MSAQPVSLARRLSLAAAVLIAAAMVFATVAIGFALHRFVQGQIDQRLDNQLVFLASALRAGPDGTLSLAGNADGPPFDRPGHGSYWQITGPRNTLRARSLGERTLDVRLIIPPRRQRDEGAARPVAADGPGPDGERLHYRALPVPTEAGPAVIVASAPRAAVWGPLREALTTLAVSLGLLGVALAGATFLQVRLGLRPLARLRGDLDRVRAGLTERLPEDQPAEILPLVIDLNAMLAQNAANLERARRHVANLAHGLKTPLATLAVALADKERAASLDSRALVDAMESRIRHHLTRARMAALGGPARARTSVAEVMGDLLAVLAKVNADKSIDAVANVAPGLAVACEKQDVEEITGNLLENAFKWARSRVAVAAVAGPDRLAVITVEDDGPGLAGEEAVAALRPGQRLDEATPGYGFGLTIARELAELYGGSLDIGRADMGGLRVTIRLPTPVRHDPQMMEADLG